MEKELIAKIEAFAKKQNIAASTLCREVVNDGKFLKRLKSGGTITIKTLDTWNGFFAAKEGEAA